MIFQESWWGAIWFWCLLQWISGQKRFGHDISTVVSSHSLTVSSLFLDVNLKKHTYGTLRFYSCLVMSPVERSDVLSRSGPDCLLSTQSEEDFLDESDFDDVSIHSASVLSDTAGAPKKKPPPTTPTPTAAARRGRKKRKRKSLCFRASVLSPCQTHSNSLRAVVSPSSLLHHKTDREFI